MTGALSGVGSQERSLAIDGRVQQPWAYEWVYYATVVAPCSFAQTQGGERRGLNDVQRPGGEKKSAGPSEELRHASVQETSGVQSRSDVPKGQEAT